MLSERNIKTFSWAYSTVYSAYGGFRSEISLDIYKRSRPHEKSSDCADTCFTRAAASHGRSDRKIPDKSPPFRSGLGTQRIVSVETVTVVSHHAELECNNDIILWDRPRLDWVRNTSSTVPRQLVILVCLHTSINIIPQSHHFHVGSTALNFEQYYHYQSSITVHTTVPL